jgi:tetraacyldisaccharide 4'-kinase
MHLRNMLYDRKIFPSSKPDIPTISVGNLCVGGTGKTPHIEYLIQVLKNEFYIATLSRGYGRNSSGFVLADTQSTASEIGDEPMQFKKKYAGIRVAVDEKRVRGIQKLLNNFPSLQAVLLDDAFQHRAIAPGLSILLTDFSKLYVNDFVIPTGNLREFRNGSKRADIIIVTKCPHVLLQIERKRLTDEIKPQPRQQIYFSSIKYGDFIPLHVAKNPFTKEYYFERNFSVLLVTGIANTSSLSYYLKDKIKNVEHIKFPDHHDFSKKDLEKIRTAFSNMTAANKLILTTEKDAMRLKGTDFSTVLKDLPVFYIPIEVAFDEKDKNALNNYILNYVRTHQRNSNLHSK